MLLAGLHEGLHRLARPPGPGDSLADVLAGVARRLEHRQDCPPLDVELDQAVEIAAEPVAPRAEPGTDLVEPGAKQDWIEHVVWVPNVRASF